MFIYATINLNTYQMWYMKASSLTAVKIAAEVRLINKRKVQWRTRQFSFWKNKKSLSRESNRSRKREKH